VNLFELVYQPKLFFPIYIIYRVLFYNESTRIYFSVLPVVANSNGFQRLHGVLLIILVFVLLVFTFFVINHNLLLLLKALGIGLIIICQRNFF